MNCYWKTVILILLGFTNMNAQSSQDTIPATHVISSYHEYPLWIQMMEDPQANYFETKKAFYTYWQGRELPAESEGEANKLDAQEKEGLAFKNPASYSMIYQYKRFKNWEKTVVNRIDPQTGRILNEDELQAIWKQQTKGTTTHIE